MPRTPKTAVDPQVDDLVATAEADADQIPPESPEDAAKRIFDSDLTKRTVVAKLARIMADLPTIEPGGHNKHFDYRYITDKQVNSVVRPRMAREHLIVIPDVVEESWVETKTARGGTSWVTKLKVLFTVIDADSGDSISGHGFGYGDDSGDKGANKAFTAAMKYWLLKLFQMGGEDDLESDARADERAAGREAGAAPSSVRVDGAQIEGVARGGRSERITGTQARQIIQLVKDMEWTPERFQGFVAANGGDLQIPDEGDPNPAIKAWLGTLSADKAGALITLLINEKDKPAEASETDQDQDGIPLEEEDPSGGYPG